MDIIPRVLLFCTLGTLLKVSAEEKWESSNMFCCYHGYKCIPSDKMCDGKADCPLGSDEGNRCSSVSLLYWSSQELWLTRLGDAGTGPKRVMRTTGKIGHVAVDMHQGFAYWSDLAVQEIKSVTLRGQMLTHFRIQGFKDIRGMSYDWLSGVLFIIDTGRHELLACPVKEIMCSVVVEHLHKPRAVAVNPFDGWLYWADSESGIHSSRLDGSEQDVLVAKDATSASSLALDVFLKRLFWVDTELSLISSMSLNDTDVKILMEFHSDLISTIAVDASQIYWVEGQDNSDVIMTADKRTGKTPKPVVDAKRDWILGIEVIHSTLQEHEPSVCEQSVIECSHLCLPGVGGQPTCLCPAHLELASDGMTCKDRRDGVMLMVVSSMGLLKVYMDSVGSTHSERMMVDSSDADDISTRALQTVSALGYNPITYTVYLCDPITDHIYALRLTDNKISPLVNGSLWSVRNIVVDWVSSHLYWLNMDKGVIEASKLDGSSRVIIIEREMDTLTGMAVAPTLGWLFYASVGIHSHIEKCNLAATSCHELIAEPDDPYLITVDEASKVIYWVDQTHHFIKSASVEEAGTTMKILVRHSGKPVSMVVDDGILYWTEQESWDLHYASAIDGSNPGTLAVGADRLGSLVLVKSTHNSGHDFCRANNGGCSHLCFSTPVGRICTCPIGMSLVPDNSGTTCQPSGMVNNMCGLNKFTCQLDLECIPLEKVCDGIFQCTDRSDEDIALCQDSSKLHVSRVEEDARCGRDHYMCARGDCIPLSDACDGNRDCEDGSDEGLLCDRACKAPTMCNHTCAPTPYGPKCLCPLGYSHQNDEYSCQDIDECDTGGATCRHVCINVPGNYTCACFDGYEILPDGITCKAKDDHLTDMIFARGSEINSIHLTSGSQSIRNVAMTTLDGSIMAVDIDSPTGDIYWAVESLEKETPVSHIVRHSHQTGEVKPVMMMRALMRSLTVDWVTGNVYFTDMKHNAIWVCQLATRWCLKFANNVHHPRTLTLDPKEGLMFFALVGTSAKIERAWMNGDHQETIVSQHIIYPISLTLDLVMQQLYWADAYYDTVETASYSGSKRRVLHCERMSHPLAIQVFESKIYWSEQMSESVSSMNKDWGDEQVVVFHSELPVTAMVIRHPLKQPYVKNRCMELGCSHLCLLTPGGASCKCPQCWKPLAEDSNTCSGPEGALPKQDIMTGLIECPHNRCFNGSLCVPQDNQSAPCSCPGGFSGIRCDNRTGIVVPYPILAKSSYIWVAGVLCVLVLSILTVFGAIYCCRRRRMNDADMISIIRFRNALLGEEGAEVQADTEGLVNSSFENPGFTVEDDENANCSAKVPMITSASDDSLDSAFVSRRDSPEADNAWDTRPLTTDDQYDSS